MKTKKLMIIKHASNQNKDKKKPIYLLNYNETTEKLVKTTPKEQWKYTLTRTFIMNYTFFGAIHYDIKLTWNLITL